MIGVVAGALAGLLWGSADYLGGRASRRMGFVTAVAISQVAGLAVIVPLASVASDVPVGAALGVAALAGVAQALGVAALYRALVQGAMSLAAPISAAGALLPIAVGVLSGERPGWIVAAGALAALAGMVLVSTAGASGARAGIVSAGLAAVGFGAYWTMIGSAPDGTALWSVAIARVVSSVLVIGAFVAGATRRGERPGPRAASAAVVAGVVDVLGAAAFAIAAAAGDLALAAALAALYPAVTAGLAQATLGERLGRAQAIGAAALVVGVVVVAGGR